MVTGVGVATADAELRSVGKNGANVCSVNLAFNRSYKDKQDEWQSEATFVRVQLWGNRAVKFAELVKKGQSVYVSGYLRQESWENQEGQKRVAFSIAARDFQLCQRTAKNSKNNQDEPKPKPAQDEPVPASAATTTSDLPDEEIPF